MLDALKNAPEQTVWMRAAYGKSVGARLTSVGFAVALAVTLWLIFVWHAPWYVTGTGLLASAAVWWVSDQFAVASITLSKQQDRRYLLQSLRAAETVNELNLAGLFAYLPGTMVSEAGFSEERCQQIMREERDRLTDALYCDPDLYLE